MFGRASLPLLKLIVEVAAFTLISLIQVPLLLLQKTFGAATRSLAWSKARPITLADSLHSMKSAPFHKWAVIQEQDDDSMTGNQYLAAEEILRNALFGESTTATLNLIAILKQQDFDPDETEEMLEACRSGNIWAIRRTIDWVGDFIEDASDED